MKPKQERSEYAELIRFMRRVAAMFLKWSEHYDDPMDNGYNQTLAPKFEAQTSTETRSSNR